jgi:hypothetical protein
VAVNNTAFLDIQGLSRRALNINQWAKWRYFLGLQAFRIDRAVSSAQMPPVECQKKSMTAGRKPMTVKCLFIEVAQCFV